MKLENIDSTFNPPLHSICRLSNLIKEKCICLILLDNEYERVIKSLFRKTLDNSK